MDSSNVLEPQPGSVRSSIDQGDEAARHGDRVAARRHYERSLLGLAGPTSAKAAATIIRRIGRAHFDEGDFDSANDCFLAAQAISETDWCLNGIAHAVNCQALVHHVRGELDDAATKYRWAFRRAELAEDSALMAMIHQNLGSLANIQGNLTTALEHYRQALDSYRRLGMNEHLGPLWNNIGRLQTDLRMWREAEASLTKAQQETERAGQLSYQILAQVNRARLLEVMGHLDSARGACDAALEIAARSGDSRWLGEIFKQSGVVYRELNDLDSALAHLLEAERHSELRADGLLTADTAAELGVLYRMKGDNHATLKYLLRAHRLYEELGAEREIASIAARKGRFEALFIDAVTEWGLSIDAKDPYTQGHCVRVTTFACRLAERTGLVDPEDMIWFRLGGLLHDVGKVAVPDEVLNKPGPLDDEEWGLMKAHTTRGEELIADIDFPWNVADVVRSHHERWDGKGYPDGLAGTDIPTCARILALADVFDAMTTDRSYRSALPSSVALARIRQGAGEAFEPALVEEFCAMVEQEFSELSGQVVGSSEPSVHPPARVSLPGRETGP